MNTQSTGFLLGLFFLAGCASSADQKPTASKLLASVELDLHFSSTGLPNIHTLDYTISRDARITQVDDDWERRWRKKRTATRRLTAEGWQKFRMALDRLDVFRWKPRYAPVQHIDDGYGWELQLSGKGRSVRSQGANAGPSLGHPEQTTSSLEGQEASGDELLAAALDELWKSSRP